MKKYTEIILALILIVNLISSMLDQFDVLRPDGMTLGVAKILFAIYFVGIIIHIRMPREK